MPFSGPSVIKPSAKPVLLTGIRASHTPHLGNYLGAIEPAVRRQDEFQTYLFIADLHGLTTNPKATELRQYVQAIAATWLAAGLDPARSIIWRQSDVVEHAELSYILSCVTSMGLLERSHSYKDALAKGELVKAGRFFYPVLMSADILLYDADVVPVGKDQAQHLEMARDMATYFNETYSPILKLPQALISEELGVVPGIDGRKMSKSYGNGISIFESETEIKKQVMAIKTDSKGLAEPKVAEECLVYQIYKAVAEKSAADEMKRKLEAGNYGYGDAKKTLLATILDSYGPMRKEFDRWMKSADELERVLLQGAEKARQKARQKMNEVRHAVGIGPLSK